MVNQLQNNLVQTLILACEDELSIKDKIDVWFSCFDEELQRKFPVFSNYASTS